MSTSLTLPGGACPSNLHLPEGATATLVDADVHNICERVAEIDPNLHVWVLEGQGAHAFAITEHSIDGVERLIFRVKELDERVCQRLREIMATPFEVRFSKLEEQERRDQEARDEATLEDLYERMGRPMWTDLERCGFIQRPVSYPKTGVTGGRGSKQKARLISR